LRFLSIIMRRALAWTIITAAVVCAVAVVLQPFADSRQKAEKGIIAVGETAPDFAAVDLSGKQVQLSQYRGQVVLLHFWASWCAPCVREMPLLNRLSQSHNENVKTIFVNVGESKATIREYLAENGFELDVVIDATGKIAGSYHVPGLPATMIVDRNGTFNHILLGELREDMPIDRWLAEL